MDNPALVIVMTYALLSSSDWKTSINFFVFSFVIISVTFELGAIIRHRMSFWHILLGWLPLRILKTLNCSWVKLWGLRNDDILFWIQFAVYKTFRFAFTCSLAKFFCFISFSSEATITTEDEDINNSYRYNYYSRNFTSKFEPPYRARVSPTFSNKIQSIKVENKNRWKPILTWFLEKIKSTKGQSQGRSARAE